MRVLITNDDGVYAPGLAALHQAVSARHQVVVVAPETEQSAVGHAITLVDPIRVRPLGPRTGFEGWAITGTPADCVKLAVHELMDEPPQAVLSGINLGANVGINVLYSGTVSAATEAAIYGLPAMAVSLGTLTEPDFGYAAQVAAHLLDGLLDLAMPQGICLNVNVPAISGSQVKGVRLVRQSQARLQERFLRRTDPRGHVYYWQAGETMESKPDPETDFASLLDGWVTVCPVGHDMTHYRALEDLDRAGFSLPPGK